MKNSILIILFFLSSSSFSQLKVAYIEPEITDSTTQSKEVNQLLMKMHEKQQESIERIENFGNSFAAQQATFEYNVRKGVLSRKERKMEEQRLAELEKKTKLNCELERIKFQEEMDELFHSYAENRVLDTSKLWPDLILRPTDAEGDQLLLYADERYLIPASDQSEEYLQSNGLKMGFVEMADIIEKYEEQIEGNCLSDFRVDIEKEMEKNSMAAEDWVDKVSQHFEKVMSEDVQHQLVDEWHTIDSVYDSLFTLVEEEWNNKFLELRNDVAVEIVDSLSSVRESMEMSFLIYQIQGAYGFPILYRKEQMDLTALTLSQLELDSVQLRKTFELEALQSVRVVNLELLLKYSYDWWMAEEQLNRYWFENSHLIDEMRSELDEDIGTLFESMNDLSPIIKGMKLENCKLRWGEIWFKRDQLRHDMVILYERLLFPIMERLNKAIEDEAQAAGYDVVLNSGSSGVVFYADPHLDITGEVLKRMQEASTDR